MENKNLLDVNYGELDNSEYFPSIISLNRITDQYDVVYVDRPIRIYFRHDGIVRLSDKPSRHVKWPRGKYLRALDILNNDIDYLWKRPNVFLSAARKVTRLGLHIGRSPYLQLRDLGNGRAVYFGQRAYPAAVGLPPRPTPPAHCAQGRFRYVRLGAGRPA